MKKLVFSLFLVINPFASFAEDISIASSQYVKDSVTSVQETITEVSNNLDSTKNTIKNLQTITENLQSDKNTIPVGSKDSSERVEIWVE